ncbi:flavin containing amine oxidoreductase [Colletotrichum graminicola M1.001]|uniref:Flavin containing amine oxidoreductase n=1 Tax=Colletotrichum graminicola (strain M1.001 / M2 / FGSC 10212) TaxID=645133 RepID=E3QNI9_COLGM|nr:flavin containing amine oxidoreductase [Colletotrichum graminicola M1.001]EFQ32476.1 flavin containing amine oxidoreductase [Colletotrichum graminicola M1.001]
MSTEVSEPVDSYKSQWARYVSRTTFERDVQLVSSRLRDMKSGTPIPNNVAGLAELTEPVTTGGLTPEKPGEFRVGIVGAGVAGLFTALLLDWVCENVKGLKIDYDILEASDKTRFGGRLFTHYFDDPPKRVHDYYDVGAMRFPDNTVMDRTFRLFEFLGIKKIEKGQPNPRKRPEDPPVLVQYFMEDTKDVCPSLFNDRRTVGRVYKMEGVVDPYDLNKGLLEDQRIPEKFLKVDPNTLFEEAIRPYIDAVKDGLDKRKTDPSLDASSVKTSEAKAPGDEELFWKMLRQSDRMSVRQFLLSKENPSLGITGPGYSYNTVEWMETATYGTGWYDQSLTEAVLEHLDFATEKPINDYWWCVDGGAQKMAEEMRKKLKNPDCIQFNSQVVAMDAHASPNRDKAEQLSLKIRNTKAKPDSGGAERDERYFTVFNSTTLGSMGRMDLSKAGLLWDTKQAIRCLGYGASCKVGMRFKEAWWRKKPFNITQGGLARTDLPLQVCVYPSYNIHDDVDEPAVLLVSYTWGQEAQRIASLISSNSPAGEEELKKVLLHDLAMLHSGVASPYEDTLALISGLYDTHHAYDWYRDPHMAGAFAYFGPCQFWDLYPAITKPNAFGQLYFVGEAASAHHAWVVGALESVVRAAWSMFNLLHQGSLKELGGEGYKPYLDAMDLLEKDAKEEGGERLPFYPLPTELPMRRKGQKAGELIDHPDYHDGKETPMKFGAALSILSVIECFIEEFDKMEGVQSLMEVL